MVTITPFTSSLKSINKVSIATVAVAYDCDITHMAYVLFYHQALLFEKLDNIMLCQNQLRHNQVEVNAIPLIHIPISEKGSKGNQSLDNNNQSSYPTLP